MDRPFMATNCGIVNWYPLLTYIASGPKVLKLLQLAPVSPIEVVKG